MPRSETLSIISRLVLAIGSDYCNADRRLPANLVGMSIILHSSACGPARMAMVAVDVSLYCIGECGGALCNTELAHTQCTSAPDKHRFMPLPSPPNPYPPLPNTPFFFAYPFDVMKLGTAYSMPSMFSHSIMPHVAASGCKTTTTTTVSHSDLVMCSPRPQMLDETAP